MRYFAWCDYEGATFSGWQRQQGQPTVQQTIEDSLAVFTHRPIEITGCGRTDAGVHARNYVFHFDLDEPADTPEFLYKCNQLLPDTIAVKKITEVAPEAHARFSAQGRYYVYRIHGVKSPLERHYSWYYPYLGAVDPQILHDVASIIGRQKKFGSFCKTNGSNKTTHCNINHCGWETIGNYIELHIDADRFLRGMVRLITGASLNVASGKMSLTQFRAHIAKEAILPHAWSVPPHGLTLEAVDYSDLIR